ncbi:alpha/beta hydrolase [Halomonas sp. HP20-15]|uniref:alpha/beta fold hydrolase n=1 Tax=Halomonas sp. HP20-15 TaxID=3085901 RepID=UPI0029826570|nr:alpha/beta hydrolase [Halomonas sp. HP20-15]MDW5376730.1 alpha/beta hydrolase [Halomonas sp. HP20-15]
MHADFALHQGVLRRPDQLCAWRRLERADGRGCGTLLLLHGAGVAGELTWGAMVGYLNAWQTLLIPDLRGMGKTHDPDHGERSFELDAVVDDVLALLDEQRIERLAVVGYSFGGLVAMRLKQRLGERIGGLGLLEPALLERADHAAMVQVREHYAEAAERLRGLGDPGAGVAAFLDLIAPNRTRNPRAERLSHRRLARRPLGFANALDCVTRAVHRLDREALLADQRNVISLVGGKSLEPMKDYHAALDSARDDWRFVEVPGTDHSLPFQKPRRIGELLLEHLAPGRAHCRQHVT